MSRIPFKSSGGITVSEDSYSKLKEAIDAAVEQLDQVEIADDGGAGSGIPGLGKGQGQGKGQSGLGFGVAPEINTDPASADPAQMNRDLNALMMQAGALCEHGDPPRKEIDAIKRPGQPLYWKCRHAPPHYFDKDGNDIDRP